MVPAMLGDSHGLDVREPHQAAPCPTVWVSHGVAAEEAAIVEELRDLCSSESKCCAVAMGVPGMHSQEA